ncbi:alpha/beta hydrolase family protein [Georgenia alba]|uniref:Alpha/beta hydrolase family protein n=1 Tax=Georgenia alba TaxID=2233858 RepID=A0ABW2QAA7_9MICO
MRYRRLGASIVLVLLLGLVGSLAGPGWNPQPLEQTIVPQATETTIGSDARTDPVGTYDVTTEVVEVPLEEGVTVEATIAAPVGAAGERPGVLFMHGAGTATHENFGDITRDLASAGIVTMVPDKRSDTYSTRDRDYVAMAEDYLDSFGVLREWPGVDASRVGVYGESEGAMSAPVAAVLQDAVAFVVLVSAPVLPIREQGAFAADNYLRDVGVPDRLLRAIPRLIGGSFPGGGFEYFDFDVRPYQQQLTQPVLMVYGAADTSMPIVQGAQVLAEDLDAADNDDYTIRYYAGANHGIRIEDVLVPAFPRDLSRWVQGLPDTAGASPVIAGAEPVQSFRVDAVDRPRWYATGDMIVLTLVAGLGLLLVGGAGALAVGIVRRRRRMQDHHGVGRLTAGLTMATLATWVLFVAYLAGVASLALNYDHDAVLVQGGWLVVQGAGVLAAAMVVLTVVAGRRTWRDRGPRRGGGRAGLVASLLPVASVVAGSLVLLTSAAYWGVYPTVL